MNLMVFSGLEDMSKKGEISVVQADKGGAILIVKPELLQEKVMEKLENQELYTKLRDDPQQDLKKELFELWKFGKNQNLVSEKVNEHNCVLCHVEESLLGIV